MRKIKMGIVGLGRLGMEHGRNIAFNIPNAELIAVCSAVQEEVDKVLAERDEKLSKAGATFTPQYFKRAYNLQDGDLVEQAAAPADTKAALAAVDFAEEDLSAPDQDAIDAAMDALSNDALNADARAMLAPLLAAVNKGLPPDQLLGQLAELYPRMDTAGLQQRLARVLFVSKLWGRLHGND